MFGDLGAVAYETATLGDIDMLLPAEREQLSGVSGRRLGHFAAGRSCARAALSALGIAAVPLLRRDDRRPDWPPGAEGSISHTDGLCVAVAARTSDLAGRRIGIDVERCGRVRPELYTRLFTRREIGLLERLSTTDRSRQAAIGFSAKEAFYKAQYPLTGAWVGFTDVELEVTPDGVYAHRVTDLDALDRVQWPVRVGIDVRPGLVIAAVVAEPAGGHR